MWLRLRQIALVAERLAPVEEALIDVLDLRVCYRGQMKALEQRQKQFDAQVKALCESGKRDEAQKKALLFEKEMTKDPTIQAVSKCSEIAKGMMSDMPFMKQGEKPSDKHVCDSY